MRRALATCLLALLACGASAAAQEALVEQPRAFGYSVGDLLTQRVLLPEGMRAQSGASAQAERIGVWLERRAPRYEPRAEGGRWLVVDYQLINAPQLLTTVTLPAWTLKLEGREQALRIPAWTVSVNALTPRIVLGEGGLLDLRPDRIAPVLAIGPLQRALWLWSAACLLSLGAWLGWWLWRQWRARARQPFALALRALRHVDECSPAAWQALHRAFDATAGQVIQGGALPRLFERAPQLQARRAEIERFYAESNALFFGAGLPAQPMPLRVLCRALRRIEKSHER